MLKVNRIGNKKTGFYTKIYILIFVTILLLLSNGADAAIKEARAVWVTRGTYTPRPNPSEQQSIIREIMQNVANAHMNVVIFQVRGQADAYYTSNYEPWANRLRGRLGIDPGYDPLEYAIKEAHARGLKLHAWINVFPCWNGNSPPLPSNPEHIYNAHPEWICRDSEGQAMSLGGEGYVAVSPGNPLVREHILNVSMDIINRYDIDGFHLDYIRYPDNSAHYGYSYDDASLYYFEDREGNPNGLSWANWQREQVNTFVRDLYTYATDIKPKLRISAAVLGKYDYASTGSSWNGYNQNYQDAAAWTTEGNMDYLAPMLYGALTTSSSRSTSFDYLLNNWVQLYSHGRHVYAGIGAYKLLDNFQEIEAQIDHSRVKGAKGVVFFSYSTLKNAGFFDDLVKSRFFTLANVPPMIWKDDIPPEAPANLVVSNISHDAVMVDWQAPPLASDGEIASYYNIYRSAGRSPLDIEDPIYHYKITGDTATYFIDTPIDPSKTYYYWISALDAADNESPTTPIIRTDVENLGSNTVVQQFKLYPNYPNPFNAETAIQFEVPSHGTEVLVEIYNLNGGRVTTLVNESLSAGLHQTKWYGTDENEIAVASGTYVCVGKCGDASTTMKLILLR